MRLRSRRRRSTDVRSALGIIEDSVLWRLCRARHRRHTFAGLFLASGGDIFKLSKILGHSSVAITQQVYAHLHPDAFAEDYSRVSFAMPEKTGVMIKLQG